MSENLRSCVGQCVLLDELGSCFDRSRQGVAKRSDQNLHFGNVVHLLGLLRLLLGGLAVLDLDHRARGLENVDPLTTVRSSSSSSRSIDSDQLLSIALDCALIIVRCTQELILLSLSDLRNQAFRVPSWGKYGLTYGDTQSYGQINWIEKRKKQSKNARAQKIIPYLKPELGVVILNRNIATGTCVTDRRLPFLLLVCLLQQNGLHNKWLHQRAGREKGAN